MATICFFNPSLDYDDEEEYLYSYELDNDLSIVPNIGDIVNFGGARNYQHKEKLGYSFKVVHKEISFSIADGCRSDFMVHLYVEPVKSLFQQFYAI